jgi:hypothetical protein
MARLMLLAAASLALVAALAGCGNRSDEPRTFAETEGLYLELGELEYQIQLSRQINPNITSDRDFLVGVSETVTPPTDEEAWFGIFLRVENQTEETLPAADDFEIVDTEENVYRPVEVDTDLNAYAYEGGPLEPGQLIPPLGSTAQSHPIGGSLLLFKVPYSTFQARPLEFKIKPSSGEEGTIDIDV